MAMSKLNPKMLPHVLGQEEVITLPKSKYDDLVKITEVLNDIITHVVIEDYYNRRAAYRKLNEECETNKTQ